MRAKVVGTSVSLVRLWQTSSVADSQKLRDDEVRPRGQARRLSLRSCNVPTPDSTTTAYASPSDLVVYHDWRQVSDWAHDDDTRDANQSACIADPTGNISRALLWSSGQVESACSAGVGYQPADLAALAGAGREFLKGLVCDLALNRLARRRFRLQSADAYPAAEAFASLDRLRKGEWIFGLIEAEQAGVGGDVDLFAPPSPPRLSREAERLFGQRFEGC